MKANIASATLGSVVKHPAVNLQLQCHKQRRDTDFDLPIYAILSFLAYPMPMVDDLSFLEHATNKNCKNDLVKIYSFW